MKKYKTILIDPPWPLKLSGRRKRTKGGMQLESLPYKTMNVAQMLRLPVRLLGDIDSHLWLWTTNQFLEDGLLLMRAWGYKYLSPIHVIKPSGTGNYFVQRTQTVLFGYKEKCRFELDRYKPNIIHVSDPKRHSEKWEETYEYIESISCEPRLEIFARRKRQGWDVWGDEVECDIKLDLVI